MKSLLVLGALFVCATAFSRPLVIENNSPLPPYAEDFAFAGDEMMGTHTAFTGGNPPDEEYDYFVDLYRRGSDGKWTFVQQLVREHSTVDSSVRVSMSSTVAAIYTPNGLQIWERTSSGWARGKVDPALSVGVAFDVVGNTVLAYIPEPDGCEQRAAVLTRGTNAVWGLSAELDVPEGVCLTSGDLDNGRAILGAQDRDDTIAIDRAFIFEQSGSTWNLAATLSPNDGSAKFARSVAIRGDVAIVSANKRGSHVYERSTAGWLLVAFLPNEDSYDGSQEDYDLQMTDEFVVKAGTNINRQNSVGYVYRRLTNSTFEHVANLAPKYGMSTLHVDGRRVIGGVVGGIFEFNLPTSFSVLTPVQDDFESGAGAQWTQLPGSQFAVVNNGRTNVFRQSAVVDGGAIHSLDLTNQNVSADFRPIAFQSGVDGWVGLVTRYTDSGNYYYVSLRSSGYLVLRKMVNGAFTELARVAVPATLAWHRIGLESTGTLHNIYVDGVRVAYVTDATHKHGHPGFRVSRASADIDNIVVTPGPQAEQGYTDRVVSGGIWDGNWVRGGSTFIQTSPDAGDARALTGLPRKDGAVQADVTFNSGSSSSTPWVGLIVRYVDARNYYYVTMRANELSLRKLTNGAITVLDSEPYTRQAGVPVKMRLEAVRDRVRVYVNDELRLEGSAGIVAGKVGLMTYKASAKFENYYAYEP
jgi:hypothetical protein